MRYLSPATFTGEPLSDTLDKKAIQLLRKKWIADLELSGETTIQINEYVLTRNDIVQYFDELMKDEQLNYHNVIAADPVLLSFLENSWIERNDTYVKNPVYKDPQFLEWISPYFQFAFQELTDASFLEDLNEDGVTALMRNGLLMTPMHMEQCWEKITRYIMNDRDSLREYVEQTKQGLAEKVTVPMIAYLMSFTYTRILQLLPVERFTVARDLYAMAMHAACIAAFNNEARERTEIRSWLENSGLLAVSPEVKTEISNRLREMDSLIPEESTGSSSSGGRSGVSGWGVFSTVVFVIIMVIRIASWSSRSSSSHSNYNSESYNRMIESLNDQNNYYHKEEEKSAQRKMLDSVLRKRLNEIKEKREAENEVYAPISNEDRR